MQQHRVLQNVSYTEFLSAGQYLLYLKIAQYQTLVFCLY